jgi:DNA mismatch repair protein MutL
LENKIKILPQFISNKIAAGEVIGRPESAVKELMENSIDSGATEVTLILKDAGKSLIQIIDNGSGMTEEDALICFQRHSTSKISTIDDLENILTLGFRGEALASIASISQVEMKTKSKGQDIGTLIKTDGGDTFESSKVNCETGTSVSVKNLFYNVPARRNFLKSNQTEFRHIYDTFIRLAISKPNINFKFINNDELLFDLKATSLHLRLKDIFSSQFTQELINVQTGNNIIQIKGFISKPNFTKKSKQDQFFYLNNRFFTNKSLNFAVYSGYSALIEKGDYPSFFLFLDIDPKKVDVNVHPSKLEVKFDDERAIFSFIQNAIKDALRQADIIFEIGFNEKQKTNENGESFRFGTSRNEKSGFQEFKKDSSPSFIPEIDYEHKSKIHSIFEAERTYIPEDEKEKDNAELLPYNIFQHSKKEFETFNVWQFQNKYIMCQTENGLMIIDQHAAHERVLYEKALLWLNSQASFSQQLLIPITFELTKIDFNLAVLLKEDLNSLGFNFNILVNDKIELTSLPADVKIGDENKIFQELIDQYKEYELKLKLDKRDNLAKSFACRSAIKSGDRLTEYEMLGLIDNLFASQLPYVCPHGRPSVIRITTEELDKRFSRT